LRRSQQFASSGKINRAHTTRFILISLIFVTVQIAVLGLGWAALKMINATRAYATGESLYSKASNAAVLNLYKYADTGKEVHWNEFRISLNVTFGDRQAREALDQAKPDLSAATAGYLLGGNHIDDIPDAILVFRLFRNWAPFEAAIEDWRKGDETIEAIGAIAAELRSLWQAGAVTQTTREGLVSEIDVLNERLTDLENSFSAHIASAARTATKLVTLVLCLLSVLLWWIGVALAWRAYRRGIVAELQLRDSEERFRNFAEVASDWFWETDHDLKITYVSERFEKATGVSPEDLLGRRSEEAGLWVVGTGEEQPQSVRGLAPPGAFRGLNRHSPDSGSL
jgi:PAS domain-containing protein